MTPLTQLFQTVVKTQCSQIVGINREYQSMDGDANASIQVYVESDDDGGIMPIDLFVMDSVTPVKGDWVIFENNSPFGYVSQEEHKNSYREVKERKPRAKKTEAPTPINKETEKKSIFG